MLEEFADAFIRLPEDFMMDLDTVNLSDTVLSPPEAAGTATVCQPSGHAFANPFDAGTTVNYPVLIHEAASSNGGPTPGLPASAPQLYSSVLRASAPHPSHPVPDRPEVSATSLALQEVKILRRLTARVTALERETREMSPALRMAGICFQQLHNESDDFYDIVRVPPLYPRPASTAAPGGSPARNHTRSARVARHHQSYHEHSRVSRRQDHRGVPHRHGVSPPARPQEPPSRHRAPHAAAAPHPPSSDMDMDPIIMPIDGSSVPSAPVPIQRARSAERSSYCRPSSSSWSPTPSIPANGSVSPTYGGPLPTPCRRSPREYDSVRTV